MTALEIPAQPEPISLELERTALIVVDMQNAFASPGGMLDLAGIDVTPARDAVAKASLVLEAARSQVRPPSVSRRRLSAPCSDV